MSRKKQIISGTLAAVVTFIAVIAITPVFYRHHVTGKLARLLDKKYGENGWVAAEVVSDGQSGEQINLYRTEYLQRLYPRYLALTPYRNLQFTHKTGWANMPPHYAVLIYSAAGEFAYRWSMKKGAWYISHHNSITILPPWEQAKIIDAMKAIERVHGLNLPRERSPNQKTGE